MRIFCVETFSLFSDNHLNVSAHKLSGHRLIGVDKNGPEHLGH